MTCVTDEFQTISSEIKIPQKEIEDFKKQVVEGDFDTALTRTVIYFVQRIKRNEKLLTDISSKHVMTFIINTDIYDHRGILIEQIPPLEENRTGHLTKQMSQNITIDGFFLNIALEAFRSKYTDFNDKLLTKIVSSQFVEDRIKTTLQSGVEKYIDKDWVSCIHILIPCIEAIVRRQLEIMHIPIYKPDREKTGNSKLRLLDEMLNDKNYKKMWGGKRILVNT